jgi:hypothetical protein
MRLAGGAGASLVVCALALAACTDGSSGGEVAEVDETAAVDEAGEDEAGEDEAEEPPAAIEEVWRTDLDLEIFSGPDRTDDGMVVAYATDDDELFLLGIDAETGEERWRQAASPGEVVTGIAVTPNVIGGYPVYFRPGDTHELFAQLVVADPATGDDVVVTDPMLFMSPPHACDDEEVAICLSARSGYEDSRTSLMLELDGDGSLEPDPGTQGLPAEGRPLSTGLYDVRIDGTEYLVAVDGEQELWRVEVEDAFGPGYTSDAGWAWSYDEQADRYIGLLGYDYGVDEFPFVLDLAWARTVALDGGSGEVLWAEDGVRDRCGTALSTPDDETLEAERDGERIRRHPVPVRCRTSGELLYEDEEDFDPTQDAVEVVLEGYEVETGETRWELALDPEEAGPLLYALGFFSEEPLVRGAGTEVVAPNDGQRVVMDLATGDQREVAEGETFWCAAPSQEFDYRVPYYIQDEPHYRRIGGRTYEWCDVDGEVLDDATPPAGVPNGVGTWVEDLVVVATPDGLRAYAVPD